jgi:hypothetical protein
MLLVLLRKRDEIEWSLKGTSPKKSPAPPTTEPAPTISSFGSFIACRMQAVPQDNDQDQGIISLHHQSYPYNKLTLYQAFTQRGSGVNEFEQGQIQEQEPRENEEGRDKKSCYNGCEQCEQSVCLVGFSYFHLSNIIVTSHHFLIFLFLFFYFFFRIKVGTTSCINFQRIWIDVS